MAKFERRGHRQSLAANFRHASPSSSLPPVGVFWDIENCQVPKGKSAMAVVQFIRKKFFVNHREAEFMCVCDISKENKEVIQELNNAQVTVVHINATCKNAADDKLRQSMRRFADIHGHPATIILISGDVNFAADLSDFNHRRHLTIVVLHNNCAPEPLLACAHQHFIFSKLLAEVPFRTPLKPSSQVTELQVGNLPSDQNPSEIRRRLKQLSDNCGGRVVTISQRTAIVRFPTAEAATRARKRMDKEDVFGSKISVNYPSRLEAEVEKSLQSRPAKRMLNSFEESNGDSSPHKQRNGSGDSSVSPVMRSRKTVFPPPPIAVPMDCTTSKQSTAFLAQESPVHRACCRLSSMNGMADDAALEMDMQDHGSPHQPGWHPFVVDCCDEGDRKARLKRLSMSTHSAMGSKDEQFSDPLMSQKSSFEKAWYWQKTEILQQEWERSSPVRHRSPKPRRNSWAPYHQSLHDRIPHHRANSHSRPDTPSPSQIYIPPDFWTCRKAGAEQAAMRSPTPVPALNACRSGSRKGSPVVNDSLFQPIAGDGYAIGNGFHQSTELLVTNLDQAIEAKDLKELLITAFRQHVMVLHISILVSPENNKMAVVKVASMQEAQYAISQLHRRKIGHKRIIISISNNNHSSLHIQKSEVMTLLRDVPGCTLPLFKFRELFEKRYHQSISLSELHKMKDIIAIQEDSTGRMVNLNLDCRNTPSPASSDGSKEIQAIMETSFCEIHCPNPNMGKGWAEKESSKALPFVHFSLKLLSLHVHKLLETHNGTLPLGSFPICYELEFGPLQMKDDGIPLEHLLAAIPGVQITLNSVGGKRIQWTENLGSPLDARSMSPPLAAQLAIFSREVVDLLKNNPRCLISFNKFIPAYHHHFGRQCRVADYGFVKLIELLEALPHVVQVMGEGNKRLLTLNHRVQVKRFSADLMRVLKSQASKQVTLDELPTIYSKCLGKDFDITSYGVCEVADMLAELAENTIMVNATETQTVIAIPKREQTPEEMEKTKQFAEEVVELLRHSPQCRMNFNKFIPAYHHHFGRQCRVSDYGLTKLIELLEAIPKVIEIEEGKEEKILVLREQELLKVLAEQVTTLVRTTGGSGLPLHAFVKAFTEFYGHTINFADYAVTNEQDLLKKIGHAVKVVESSEGLLIVLMDKEHAKRLSSNVRLLLMEQPEGMLSLDDFHQKYAERFGETCNLLMLQMGLVGMVEVEEDKGFLQLHPLQIFARNVCVLMHDCNGSLLLYQFMAAYQERFSLVCLPTQYGFSSLVSLLLAIPEVVHLRGKGHKRMVLLNKDTRGTPFDGFSCQSTPVQKQLHATSCLEFGRPSSTDSAVPDEDEELLQIGSPIDLLSIPVPSCVPSPCLQPSLMMPSEKDLMRFDSPISSALDIITGVPESKYLPAPSTQDSLLVTSAMLNSLTLSAHVTSPIPVPGAAAGVSVQDKSQLSTKATPANSPCTPPRSSPPMTSTPNGTSARPLIGSLHLDDFSSDDVKIRSCEDLLQVNEASTTSLEVAATSSQSTPTRQISKSRIYPRSRIAAQFTNPPFVANN